MSYTDSQMRVATQIAYMDIDMDVRDDRPLTVGQLLEMQKKSSDESVRRQAESLQEFIASTPGCEDCEDWIIRDVQNDQHGSGMYACMIDTQDGDALIAFRGSESDTVENIVKDWIVSDVGLVNCENTPQQIAAEQYVEELYEEYGNQYNGFGLTGHSLGGNLAEHATITAPEGMRDKIIRCVSMDGPGYSQAYIDAHWEEIQAMKGKIVHYQWSWVGGLLTPIPETHYESVQADTPTDHGIMNMFWRHDTNNLRYDENGNLIPGDMDWLAITLAPIAFRVDMLFYSMYPDIERWMSLYQMLKEQGIVGLVERWTAVFNRGNATQFEVDTQVLQRSADNIYACGKRLDDIGERILGIQNQLAYSSFASGFIRNKLWFLLCKLDSDGNKLRKLGKNGSECGYCYSNAEQQIENSYA